MTTPHTVPPKFIVPSENVIIVGAGMSGLVAAYELKRAGYNVQILEMSQRYGGRVKTLDQKDGYDRGLHTDGKLHKAFYQIHSCSYDTLILQFKYAL